MRSVRSALWGPSPLPDFLTEQLSLHGFSATDAGRCARQITEHPGDAAAASLFVDLGGCKFLEGDVDGAIAAWRHAISSNHDAAASRALLNLGLLYEHLHLHAAALGVFSTVADRNVDPYVAPAAMASARCQVALDTAEHAMETMARLAQHTMSVDPDSADLIETLYGLGEVAEQAGRLDRAERSWRVASLSPASELQEAATDRLIQLLLNQGHDDELLELFDRQPVDRRTVSGTALVDRAEALARRGQLQEAAALAGSMTGLGLAIGDRFRLAELRVQTGDVNAAIDELESLLAEPDDQTQHRAGFSLGEIYQSYDMFDAATTMFEQVAESADPYWSPKATLALGDLREVNGDLVAARGYWTTAAMTAYGPAKTLAENRLKSATPDAVAATRAAGERARDLLSERQEATEAMPMVVDTGLDDSGLDDSGLDDSGFGDTGWDEISLGDGSMDTPIAQPVPPLEPQVLRLDEVEMLADEPEIILLDGEATGPESPGPGATSLPMPPTEEPQIVVLAALDEEALASNGDLAADTPSAFADHLQPTALGELENPYASLAPDDESGDVTPSTRNPYAELAPNYDDSEPPPDVRTGDWESMLEDWPGDDSESSRSSAFSRYT